MLSIFRSGPKVIILEGVSISQTRDYLIENFDAQEYEINTAFEKSTENTTIIFLTNKKRDVITPRDICDVLYLENQAESVLCKIINDKKYDLIMNARMAPRIIVMKTFGNTDKVINQLLEDYGGETGNFNEMLESKNKGTVIAFTQKYLSDPLNLTDLHEKSLHVNRDYPSMMRELKIHDLKYLNIGFDNKDWHELTIKIYDSYGRYDLHYQRLLKILEHLEIGFILGEAWGKDAATIFLSVDVYRVRFFTYYEPKYIKKILLGLEYLDDGTRIVDLDLYQKRKKIYWIDIIGKDKREKEELSKISRDEIFSQFNEKLKEEVIDLERQILEGRR